MMDVSIIIVSYNTCQLTRNCLGSVFEQTKEIDFEVIVSDNGSSDGSIEMIKSVFPQVILIENNANLGFGVANNRGLKIAKGKYVFYLNSDTVLLNNAVKMFFDYWEESPEKERIGALGGVLLDEKMQTMHSGGDFPDYKFLCSGVLHQIKFHFIKTVVCLLRLGNVYQKLRKKKSSSVTVKVGEQDGYVTGADLFLRNDSCAAFDENFFMYYEETDLELRLKEKGLKRIIISGPKIQHLTRKLDKKFSVVNAADVFMQDSAVYYSRKNLHMKARLLRFLIFLDRLNPFVRISITHLKG